jgi:hypothetical protein
MVITMKSPTKQSPRMWLARRMTTMMVWMAIEWTRSGISCFDLLIWVFVAGNSMLVVLLIRLTNLKGRSIIVDTDPPHIVNLLSLR